MYTFIEKTNLARRHARVEHIDTYRSLLAGLRLPAATRIETDQESLAVSLLYILLDRFTIEEIQARCVREPAEDIAPPRIPSAGEAAGETSGNRPKISKFEQYPGIPWKDLDDPLVRTADSIFTDRINCWSHLKELEAATQGAEACRETLADIVETSVRLETCFDELRHFNDHGAFLGKHPFIAHREERARIADTLRNDPEAYFSERKNIELNITRYTSQINGKKATEAQKEAARANLEKYQARLRLYRDVFAEIIHPGP